MQVLELNDNEYVFARDIRKHCPHLFGDTLNSVIDNNSLRYYKDYVHIRPTSDGNIILRSHENIRGAALLVATKWLRKHDVDLTQTNKSNHGVHTTLDNDSSDNGRNDSSDDGSDDGSDGSSDDGSDESVKTNIGIDTMSADLFTNNPINNTNESIDIGANTSLLDKTIIPSQITFNINITHAYRLPSIRKLIVASIITGSTIVLGKVLLSR